MFGATLKAANSSFQKGMLSCLSIYMKKAMRLLAFIFEQPLYNVLKFPLLFVLSAFHFQMAFCHLFFILFIQH